MLNGESIDYVSGEAAGDGDADAISGDDRGEMYPSSSSSSSSAKLYSCRFPVTSWDGTGVASDGASGVSLVPSCRLFDVSCEGGPPAASDWWCPSSPPFFSSLRAGGRTELLDDS
ncbi:hypothetical protein H310_13240 [Aphanomyces invadans]|uniref:Uncharacterized protein n=1 Tax=Aphanomyces invadans TaxID=157072 RepID=A0A024TGW1_9STRA|nr:hypothetical protein H310_13240 [Aphanomyces invadans]ETV92582.1 hypothetical protein H310_13240 [Aphanomyces invadans]|eukprot:XP_008878889.1 hypothetical protein H310_13240 [Aphanomyces invadans]